MYIGCGDLSNSIWTADPGAAGSRGVAYLGPFTPGTFTGIGTGGHGGDVHVEVTFDENRITSLRVVQSNETPMFANQVYPALTTRVMDSQTYDVDIVSSVTETSTAFLNGIREAIRQAGGTVTDGPLGTSRPAAAHAAPAAPPKPTDDWPSTFEPGTYDGYGMGHGGEIAVEVTFDETRMLEIVILEHNETALMADPVWRQMIPSMIQAQTYNVDTVSGGTFTSIGLMEAVIDAALIASND
jgi:uncharacterized protein with FMN-binding domain